MNATSGTVDLKVDDKIYPGAWTLSPQAKPDIFEVPVKKGQKVSVVFSSGAESLTFSVEPGKSIDFNILYKGETCWTRIVGVLDIPEANYDQAFQRKHRGKVAVTVPEVYELGNVLIALSEPKAGLNNLVWKKGSYYQDVMDWFGKYQEEPIVSKFLDRLKSGGNAYTPLKTEGNSFEFDKKGQIQKRREYDRTGGQARNQWADFLAEIEAFAKKTKFREFYRAHRGVYEEQSRFFESEAGVPRMVDWLQKQFPNGQAYDFIDIIFSPLVFGWQSSTWFESNGFKVLQPHVNYPYPISYAGYGKMSVKGQNVMRGMLVFTEINHGFLNPESDRHAEKVIAATTDLDKWIVPEMRSAYSGIAVFNEYVNWALISVWAIDSAPEDAPEIAKAVAKIMKNRGFPQFEGFQENFLKAYRERVSKTTIAYLYPKLIEWCAEHNR